MTATRVPRPEDMLNLREPITPHRKHARGDGRPRADRVYEVAEKGDFRSPLLEPAVLPKKPPGAR